MDPRSGEVSTYPPPVTERLEAAYCNGGDSEVRLAGLGGVFECLIVDLGRDSESPTQFNPLTGGRRDVRRLELAQESTQVSVHVIRERGWRVADFPVPNLTEERLLLLHGDTPKGGDTGRGCRHGATDDTGEKERLAAAEECDREGLVALWEWCRVPASAPDDVPPDMWGVYGEEQDRAIELAFRAGASGVQISVGIRNYEVTFRGANGGRQEDKAMRKRRLVRRRAVTHEQREEALNAAANETNENPELADGECAICCTAFAETAAVPVVRLPGCGHCFHGACVQHIADKRGTCPFCRAEVDWKVALTPQARAGLHRDGGIAGRPVADAVIA